MRLKTECGSCPDKCCSQPYDWVYLTAGEISRLVKASGVSEEVFVIEQTNANTGHAFRILKLPCRFFDSQTGSCTVYESRPLACRVFPFYVDPITGNATFHPAVCGEQLSFPAPDDEKGWRLIDLEGDVRQWMTEFWQEATSGN
ncbi:MAG TPA: YkgJ family cysteine cluster protein [Pyrinomonadaceae bacterium]|nr:YkgJ family cysteine cluster protein [Pyrinomonadaceae bacterium]